MARTIFTHAIAQLILMMIEAGEHPIIDFVKRTDEEQNRLYRWHRSKCDGYNKISQHQVGHAADILFVDGRDIVDPNKGWDYWHERWSELGGAPKIVGDEGHFEMR